MKTGTIIIRADANAQIGAGHFMRCLALAQAWKDRGCEAVFITTCRDDNLLKRWRDEGFSINIIPGTRDWTETRTIIDKYPNAWVVLDGYHFNEDYQRRTKEAGHRLLVIDDMANLKHYYADIVLNQNFGAEHLKYPCEPCTRLLLGADYALLRREFLSWRGWKREIPEEAKQVLVTLGGSDPENHSLKVIQALQQLKISGLAASMVAGASNPNIKVLEAAVKQSRVPLQLVYNADNMPELMARADIAVIAAGITVWESAFMGCATISYVRNVMQENIIKGLDGLKILKYQGYISRMEPDSLISAIHELSRDRKRRRASYQVGRKIVDGQGTVRVLNAIADINH